MPPTTGPDRLGAPRQLTPTPTGSPGHGRMAPAEAVIFDFNGTLSDDEPVLLQIFTELFAAHLAWELQPSDYYDRLVGHSDREIIEIVVADRVGDAPELVETLLAERRRRYCELVAAAPTISSDTVELVRRLADAGVPLGIVTGAQRADVEFVIARAGIAELFDVVVCEEDVSRGKPDPEGFLRAAAVLAPDGVARTVVFEDSLPGIRAAKAAGMRCVAVAGARNREVLEEEADLVVDRLGPELVSSLLAPDQRAVTAHDSAPQP